MYYYSAYDLVIKSEFEIPEFPQTATTQADVFIRRGDVPANLHGTPVCRANWQAIPDCFLMAVAGTGRFLVRNGNEIVVTPNPDAYQGEINLFLCGTMIAAILQQRHHLTLHSSSVLGPKGAVLFVGKSGVGKSTTLAAMVRLGYKMISDDVTALRQNAAQKIEAVSAVPRNRLWNDSASIFGHDVAGMNTIRPDIKKFNLPVSRFHASPSPVSHIFILTRSENGTLRTGPIKNSEAHQLLRKFTYRKRFMAGMGLQEFQFRQVSELVKNVPISLITRPTRAGFKIDDLTSAIENRIQRAIS